MVAGARFPYGPRPGMLIAGGVLFGGAGVLFVQLARSEASVRLWPLGIHISGGPVYVLALVSFAFPAVTAAAMFRARQLGPRELVVDEDFLEAPRGPWSADRVRLTRDRIRGVERVEVSGTKVVTLVHEGGKLSLTNRTVGEDGLAAVEAWLRRGA